MNYQITPTAEALRIQAARTGYSPVRHFSLGDTQSFRYQDNAIALANTKFAATPSADYVLVTYQANGKSPVAMPFAESEYANEAYNDVIDAPGGRVYAAVIDRDGGVWNEWFGATVQVFETWFNKEKLRQLAPWIVGGAALIAGTIYFTRKGVKRRRARRRR